MAAKNLSFQYLHRDEGNYKTFGEVIFVNPDGIGITKAEVLLREKLIDGEYFYPLEVKIPLFVEHTGLSFFSDWYEFTELLATDEQKTDDRSFATFLSQFP